MAEYLSPKFVLSYSLGKTTKPDVGKILCFCSPEWLEKFVTHEIRCYGNPQMILDIIIFKGLAQNPTRLNFMTSVEEESLIKFWKIKLKWKKGIDPRHLMDAPIGTLTTFAFTPTEQYTYEEFLRVKGEWYDV